MILLIIKEQHNLVVSLNRQAKLDYFNCISSSKVVGNRPTWCNFYRSQGNSKKSLP